MNENKCAYCGEDKRENFDKHWNEFIVFSQEQIAKCQEILRNWRENDRQR